MCARSFVCLFSVLRRGRARCVLDVCCLRVCSARIQGQVCVPVCLLASGFTAVSAASNPGSSAWERRDMHARTREGKSFPHILLMQVAFALRLRLPLSPHSKVRPVPAGAS